MPLARLLAWTALLLACAQTNLAQVPVVPPKPAAAKAKPANPLQSPSQPQPELKPGRLSLTIVNSVTKQPVRGAQVTIALATGPAKKLQTALRALDTISFVDGLPNVPIAGAIAATTNAQGVAEFPQVPPGSYSVFAIGAQGYRYDQPDLTALEFTPIVVAENDSVKTTMAIDANAVLEGRVIDNEGNPLRGIQISALDLTRTATTETTLTAVATATTDDRGQYRMFDLRPGRYFVRAHARGLPPNTGEELTGFQTTFYPAGDVNQATRLALAPGATQTLDFRLRRIRFFHIRGVATGPGSVSLTDASQTGISESSTSQPAGTFNFIVQPGSYILTQGGTARASEAVAVTVSDRDEIGITLSPSAPPYDLSGTVTAEGGIRPNAVRLVSVNRTVSGEVNRETGDFRIANFLPGTYRVQLAGNESYIKTIQLGGREITDGVLQLTSQGERLTLRVAPPRGQANIRVRPTGSTPTPTRITLFPAGPIAGRADLLRNLTTDANGQVQVSNLAPGEYRVIAWSRFDAKLSQIPEFLDLLPAPTLRITENPVPFEVSQITARQFEEAEGQLTLASLRRSTSSTSSSVRTPLPNVEANAAPPAGLGKLTLTTVSSANGQPVVNALVTIERLDFPDGTSPVTKDTHTNERGQAEFPELATGRYRIYAIDSNAFRYAAINPNSPALPAFNIAPGAITQLGEVRINPTGAVEGTVLNERGEPVANVLVSVMTYRVSGTRRILRQIGQDQTDDRGVYRVDIITTPSRIAVSVAPRPPAAQAAPALRFAPVFYPNAPSPTTAELLDIPAGGQLDHIDFLVRESPVFHIRGTVTGLESVLPTLPAIPNRPATLAAPLRAANLRVTPCIPGRVDEMGIGRSVQVRTAGPATPGASTLPSFDVADLTPGTYCLEVRQVAIAANTPASFVTASVTITNRDIDNLNLEARPSRPLTGKVVLADPSITMPSGVRVNIHGDSRLNTTAPVNRSTGAFQFDGLGAGLYLLRMPPLPPGVYLRSIREGDAELIDTLFEPARITAPLTLELATARGHLTGKVAGVTVPITVTLAPGRTIEELRGMRRDLYRHIDTNAQGEFDVTDLAPGVYRVYPWSIFDERIAQVPDFLKLLPAVTVEITEAAPVSIQLRAITTKEFDEAFAKF